MLKRIIFDLDNTLIMWKPEYLGALKKAIKKYDVLESSDYINSLIDDYEEDYNKYNKEILLKYINQNINSQIDMNFIDDFLYNIGFMSEPNKNVIDTLDYLSKKYELVVLTNWFRDPQINRLKNAKIYNYFKEVYGGEEVIKPNKGAFIRACGDYNPDECLMIGDNYDVDIIGAFNAGLNVIYFNSDFKENNNLKFDEICDFKELRDIL